MFQLLYTGANRQLDVPKELEQPAILTYKCWVADGALGSSMRLDERTDHCEVARKRVTQLNREPTRHYHECLVGKTFCHPYCLFLDA
jgi:hypothetical protein